MILTRRETLLLLGTALLAVAVHAASHSLTGVGQCWEVEIERVPPDVPLQHLKGHRT